MMKVYAVFDAKAEAYMQPFFVPARGQAIRMFTDGANDEKTAIARHPSDYTLFEIGEYDDVRGLMSTYEAKVPLGCALEYVSK